MPSHRIRIVVLDPDGPEFDIVEPVNNRRSISPPREEPNAGPMKKISWFDTAFGVPTLVAKYRREEVVIEAAAMSRRKASPRKASPTKSVRAITTERNRFRGSPARCLQEVGGSSPVRRVQCLKQLERERRRRCKSRKQHKLAKHSKSPRRFVREPESEPSEDSEDEEVDEVNQEEDSTPETKPSASPAAYQKFTVQGGPLQYVYYPVPPPAPYVMVPPPAFPPAPVAPEWTVPAPPPGIPRFKASGVTTAPASVRDPSYDEGQITSETLRSIKNHYRKIRLQRESGIPNQFGEHFCYACGAARSRHYHTEHPVGYGKTPKPSLCHRCRVGDVPKNPKLERFRNTELGLRRYWCARCGTIRSKAYHAMRDYNGERSSASGLEICHTCRENKATKYGNDVKYEQKHKTNVRTNVRTNVPYHVATSTSRTRIDPMTKLYDDPTPYRTKNHDDDGGEAHSSPSESRARRLAQIRMNNGSNVSSIVKSTVTSSLSSGSRVIFTPLASSDNSVGARFGSQSPHHSSTIGVRPSKEDGRDESNHDLLDDSDNKSTDTVIHHDADDADDDDNIAGPVMDPAPPRGPHTPGGNEAPQQTPVGSDKDACACPHCQGGSHKAVAEKMQTEAEMPPLAPLLRPILSSSRSSRIESSGSSTSRSVRFSNPLIVSAGTADDYDRTAHPLHWPGVDHELSDEHQFVHATAREGEEAEGLFWQQQREQDGREGKENQQQPQQQQEEGHDSSAGHTPVFKDPEDEDVLRRAWDALRGGGSSSSRREKRPNMSNCTFSWPSSPPRSFSYPASASEPSHRRDSPQRDNAHRHAKRAAYDDAFHASGHNTSARWESAQDLSPRRRSGDSNGWRRDRTHPDQAAFDAYMAASASAGSDRASGSRRQRDQAEEAHVAGGTCGSVWEVDSDEAGAIETNSSSARTRSRYTDAASQTDTLSSSRCAVVNGRGRQQVANFSRGPVDAHAHASSTAAVGTLRAEAAEASGDRNRDSGVCMEEYPANLHNNVNDAAAVASPAVSSPDKYYTASSQSSDFYSLLTDRVASWLAHTGHSDDEL